MSAPDSKEDRLLDHNYDGIQEYDNPMPRWWIYIFWATILFSVLYLINLPGVGTGKGRVANYEREMAEAQAKYGAPAARTITMTNEQLMALARDAAALAAGQSTFTTQCAACHRGDGGGNIGPNLTDEYWIHGGTPVEILGTVSSGVLEKGMPAWSQMLKPDQVTSVVAYVLTLSGTHPKDPKTPQGVKVEEAHEDREGAPDTGASEPH